MIFLIRYIYRLIVTNPGKLTFLVVGLCSLYINLNYIEKEYEYTEKVLTTFEVHGQKYVVVQDDGRQDNYRDEKLTNDLVFNKDNTELIQTGAYAIYIVLWVAFGACIITFLLSPLDMSCRWEFSDTYNECKIRDVNVDREGSKLYYHYRGRILKVFDTGDDEMYNGKGLSRHEVSNLLEEFRKSPNLYEKYIGTKSKIREGKIDKLFPND